MKLRRNMSFYEKYTKRALDIFCSLLTIIMFSWLYAIIALLVRVKLGSPVLFRQPRPGMIDPKTHEERIFDMYKFRTMTDELDETGKLKPDEERLTPFGRRLRASSLDELPEVFNILKGEMSVIGPRPQLVRDMVFMSDEQRLRHTARPGLSGLAQVSGRNALSWDTKLDLDLQYIRNISFKYDLLLVWKTIVKVFFCSGTDESQEEIELTDDYGDYLLRQKRISEETYYALQARAKQILERRK